MDKCEWVSVVLLNNIWDVTLSFQAFMAGVA